MPSFLFLKLNAKKGKKIAIRLKNMQIFLAHAFARA